MQRSELTKAIYDDYCNGMCVGDLSKKYFLSNSGIWNHLIKSGVEKKQRRVITEEDKAQIKEMCDNGMNFTEIAKEMEISPSTAQKYGAEYKQPVLETFTYADHRKEKQITKFVDKKTGKIYKDITGMFDHANEVTIQTHKRG